MYPPSRPHFRGSLAGPRHVLTSRSKGQRTNERRRSACRCVCTFLLRNAMPPVRDGIRHDSVSACVCRSQVGVKSKRMNESSWFLAFDLAPNSGLRKFRHDKVIMLSSLVDSRACRSHLRQSTRSCLMNIAYYTSVDCNLRISVLRFVLDLLYNLFKLQ